MKRVLLPIIAGAFVTILAVYFLASAILPGSANDRLPSEVISGNADLDSKPTPQSRARILMQEHEMRKLECAPMEAHLRELLDDSRVCEANSDCVLVGLGCPFGCMGAYNKSAETAIIEEEKAYQSQCHSCVNLCAAPLGEQHAVCRKNKCLIIERPTFQMQLRPQG